MIGAWNYVAFSVLTAVIWLLKEGAVVTHNRYEVGGLICPGGSEFEICLPSLYNLIEFPSNDQIQSKLFVFIISTNIYISSDKFVLNRPILMELPITFPIVFVDG